MLGLNKSKLRAKLLAYFFDHPDSEMYLREIAQAIGEDPTNLKRELQKLESNKIFISRLSGKQKYFQLNKDYLLYRELKSIVARTIGVASRLKKALSGVDGIATAFIYGSYANGQEKAASDIDLFILGDCLDSDELAEKITVLEDDIRREINYRVFSGSDLAQAIKKNNSFVLNVVRREKIFIKGDEKDFGKFIKSWNAAKRIRCRRGSNQEED